MMEISIKKVSPWVYPSGSYFSPTTNVLKGGSGSVYLKGLLLTRFQKDQIVNIPEGSVIIALNEFEVTNPVSMSSDNFVVPPGLMQTNKRVNTVLAPTWNPGSIRFKPNLMTTAALTPPSFIEAYYCNESNVKSGLFVRTSEIYFNKEGYFHIPTSFHCKTGAKVRIVTIRMNIDYTGADLIMVQYRVENPEGASREIIFSLTGNAEDECIIEGLTGDVQLPPVIDFQSDENVATVLIWAPNREIYAQLMR